MKFPVIQSISCEQSSQVHGEKDGLADVKPFVEQTHGLFPEMGSNETEVDINSGTVCGQENMEILDGVAVVGVRDQEEGGRMNYEAVRWGRILLHL